MKKIAFLMATPFTIGGEQRVVTKVANLFYKKGFEVSIICVKKPIIDYKVNGLKKEIIIKDASKKTIFSKIIIKINNQIRKINSHTCFLAKYPEVIKRLIFTSETRNKIINIINNEKYDYVVGVASEFSIFLSSYREKINPNTQIIGWQHNNFEAYFNKKGRRLYGEKKLFEKYSNKFDHYVVLMPNDKKELDAHFDINCTQIFNPLSFENTAISKLENNKFIWYGRLEYAKGVDLLIEAYKIYKENGGTWKLEIIGDGSEKEKIKEMVKNYKLEKNIKFIGFTTNIPKYLVEATIFLFPSRWEGFGLTLTESMQHGLPAICFDLTTFKEITKNFDSCYLVSSYDVEEFSKAMLTLSNNKSQIKTMSKEARKNAKMFSGTTIISKWIDMLNSKE